MNAHITAAKRLIDQAERELGLIMRDEDTQNRSIKSFLDESERVIPIIVSARLVLRGVIMELQRDDIELMPD